MYGDVRIPLRQWVVGKSNGVQLKSRDNDTTFDISLWWDPPYNSVHLRISPYFSLPLFSIVSFCFFTKDRRTKFI